MKTFELILDDNAEKRLEDIKNFFDISYEDVFSLMISLTAELSKHVGNGCISLKNGTIIKVKNT